VPRWLIAVACGLALFACGGATGDDGVPDTSAVSLAREAFSSAGIMRHITVLAHDSLEGRARGGIREERAVRYLTEQFQPMGLSSGNPDGTWVQNVQLVGITIKARASVGVNGGW